MGYIFAGFFALADESVLKKALEQWSFCKGKVIKTPFEGIGVSCPISDTSVEQLKSELLLWSTNFQSINFVFIQVECWGGMCNYWGHICNNEKIILDEVYDDDDQSGTIRLLKLLGYLGVSQTNFEPFHRCYFNNTSDADSQ